MILGHEENNINRHRKGHIVIRQYFVPFVLLLAIAGCSFVPPALNRDADIIVVGDSILAWHRGTGRSIPEVIEQASGLIVSNVAISGAQFLGPQGIPTQYVADDWDWVIVNGGGNDLQSSCQTANAQRVLDALISADGQQGAFPAFVSDVAPQGARVIVLGYYPISDRGGPFLPCRSILIELAARQSRLADANPAVVFIDSGRVIGPSDAAAYAPDLVHPSPRGAALIGQLISSEIVRSSR